MASECARLFYKRLTEASTGTGSMVLVPLFWYDQGQPERLALSVRFSRNNDVVGEFRVNALRSNRPYPPTGELHMFAERGSDELVSWLRTHATRLQDQRWPEKRSAAPVIGSPTTS